MDPLLSRALAGDEQAENELFEYLYLRFKRIAKRTIREKDCVEEIAQEACKTVLQKYRTETFHTGFHAWAHGVLRNKIGSFFQVQQRERSRRDTGSGSRSADGAASEERYQTLRMAMAQCLRMIFKRSRLYGRILIFAYQGLATADVCRRLGITPNHAYVALNKGRNLLKECLASGKV